jgi:MarR family transcriptional regulator, organic hydroperoxide resistance regulator
LVESIADLMMRVWDAWKSSSPVKRGDVTREQYRILKVLGTEGTRSVKELASRVGTTPSSASISLKRLERGELVRRTRSSEDERVVSVTITPEGRSKLNSWRSRQLSTLASLFDALEPGERESFREMLAKVVSEAGR